MPLELASPCGNRDDFELRRMRADSSALAARHDDARDVRLREIAPVFLSMYETPVASRRVPRVTSRAIAFVISVSLPVLSAGAISTSGTREVRLASRSRGCTGRSSDTPRGR